MNRPAPQPRRGDGWKKRSARPPKMHAGRRNGRHKDGRPRTKREPASQLRRSDGRKKRSARPPKMRGGRRWNERHKDGRPRSKRKPAPQLRRSDARKKRSRRQPKMHGGRWNGRHKDGRPRNKTKPARQRRSEKPKPGDGPRRTHEPQRLLAASRPKKREPAGRPKIVLQTRSKRKNSVLLLHRATGNVPLLFAAFSASCRRRAAMTAL